MKTWKWTSEMLPNVIHYAVGGINVSS